MVRPKAPTPSSMDLIPSTFCLIRPMRRSLSRITSVRRLVYCISCTAMCPVMNTRMRLNRMSLRPLVKEVVTTRTHMLTAIPIPSSRLRRNCRTRLRKLIVATTRAPRARAARLRTKRFISRLPSCRLMAIDRVQRGAPARDEQRVQDRQHGDHPQGRDPAHHASVAEARLEHLAPEQQLQDLAVPRADAQGVEAPGHQGPDAAH